MKTIDTLLRDAPLFSDLPPERVELLAGCGANVHFDPGETLFREGDSADTFYLLREGAIALETYVPNRGPVVIETLDAGEVVGWSWLFPPYKWHFDARATTLVRAVIFDAACLRDKCNADPVLGYQMMSRFAHVLVDRLQWTRVRLLDIYGDQHAD